MVPEITPRELAAALAGPQPPLVLDVREAWEWALCRLPDAVHIPLDTLPQRLAELDPARSTVVLCHHGTRSWQAAAWLARRGFARVANLEGGIDAWSREVDPGLVQY